MPDFTIKHRGKKCYIELDSDGVVLDIDDGSGRYISEDEKIAFEIDHQKAIADTMEEFHAQMAERKSSRGRDRAE